MSEITIKSLDTITIDDFFQICRLCPSKIDLVDLYNNPEIINMLESCTQLQFDENDGLPNKICHNCTTKLTQTFNFINTCKIIDETYRKCLTNPEIKVETIFLEPNIKEEFLEDEIKQETDENPAEETTEYQPETIASQGHYNNDQSTLLDFVRLGKDHGCNSLIMRYFTEREGAERLSMHFMMTAFINTYDILHSYDNFMGLCRREMTDEGCACASEETLPVMRNSELSLELRYGRITSSKIHMVSCCEDPDEFVIENIIGFYKINETKAAKNNELIMQKIEKQLNVKITKCGLILNQKYPEFVAKLDGVTDDAVIKMKYPKNHKDYAKYVDKDKNLSPNTKTEMHLLMLMTNLRTSYLCVIDPNFANTNTIVKVDFNERYFAEILKKTKIFWRLNIFPVLVKTVSHT